MSESVKLDVYTVKTAPLVELRGHEKNEIVRAELERRAVASLRSAFELFKLTDGKDAPERLSAAAADIFRDEAGGVASELARQQGFEL